MAQEFLTKSEDFLNIHKNRPLSYSTEEPGLGLDFYMQGLIQWL